MSRLFACILTALLTGGAAIAADAPGAELAAERWREYGYGVSLRPPRHMTVVDAPADDARVAFVDADGSQISLRVHESDKAVNLDALKGNAGRQLTIPFPSWLPMDDPDPLTELAGFPAGRIYFALPDPQQGNWVLGHVFVLLDDFVYVNVQMRAPAGSFASAHKTFDAVVKSIELMDPAELNALRTRQLEAGEAWLRKLDRAAMIAATPPVQLFRILAGDRDVGYLRIEHGAGEQLGIKGHRVQMRAHTESDAGEMDLSSEVFESDEGTSEFWTTDITHRGRGPAATLPMPDAAGDTATSLHETGTRAYRPMEELDPSQRGNKQTLEVIDVLVQTATRLDERYVWPTPRVAFLSQFGRAMMGVALPREATTLAFYCYSPEAKKIGLMTVRVEPIVQGPRRGGYAARVRPTSASREQVYEYDAQGRLAEWRPGDGRVFRAATAEELRKAWQGRE